MPWVRLEEDFPHHPKVAPVGPLGLSMQVAGLCYANHYLTDGFVPRAMGPLLLVLDGLGIQDENGEWSPATWQTVIGDLVRAGMWQLVEGGWRIHDYHDYQPTREEIQAARMATHEIKVAAGKARAAGAKRDGGRFVKEQVSTSTTSRPPAEPPADDQRPTSPDPVPVPQDQKQGANAPVEFGERTRPRGEVPQVFDAWAATLPPGASRKLTQPRRKAIQARLREFGLQDCLDAAVGWPNDPWPGRAEQNDIAILFRPGNFEKFRDYTRRGPPVQLGKRTQQMAANHQQMRAVGLAKGVIGNGNGVGPVGALGRPDQRELARPADRTADRG